MRPIFKVDLLLASPMRRAIQTALIGFSPCLDRGLQVVAIPEAQEGTAELSDTGSDVDMLYEWFDGKVDLQYVKPGWNRKEGTNAAEVSAIFQRTKRLRQWIKARPEKHIVLVTHGRFAHYLTGNVNEKGEQTSAWWAEGEFKSFEFAVDEPHSEEALIVETEESKERRKRKNQDKDVEH